MESRPLFIDNYINNTSFYQIKRPDIVSGSTYYFTTDSGLCYQVTFGKKKDNYLHNILNFSVISDDYEDEYSETNRGEVYKIISTMIEIIRIFHEVHPHSHSYEFSGEYKEGEDKDLPSIRTRLYIREAHRAINFRYWELILAHNKVVLQRKTRDG